MPFFRSSTIFYRLLRPFFIFFSGVGVLFTTAVYTNVNGIFTNGFLQSIHMPPYTEFCTFCVICDDFHAELDIIDLSYSEEFHLFRKHSNTLNCIRIIRTSPRTSYICVRSMCCMRFSHGFGHCLAVYTGVLAHHVLRSNHGKWVIDGRHNQITTGHLPFRFRIESILNVLCWMYSTYSVACIRTRNEGDGAE